MPSLKQLELPIVGIVLLSLVSWLSFAKADARHWKKKAESYQAQLVILEKDVRLRTAEAKAKDAAHAAKVEGRQRAVSEGEAYVYKAQLDALRARIDELRKQATANSGGGGIPAMSGPASAAAGAPGPTETARLVPDLEARLTLIENCETNTLQVQAWQRWWKDVSALPR